MLRCFFRTKETLSRAGLKVITNGMQSAVEFVCSCCLSVSWCRLWLWLFVGRDDYNLVSLDN